MILLFCGCVGRFTGNCSNSRGNEKHLSMARGSASQYASVSWWTTLSTDHAFFQREPLEYFGKDFAGKARHDHGSGSPYENIETIKSEIKRKPVLRYLFLSQVSFSTLICTYICILHSLFLQLENDLREIETSFFIASFHSEICLKKNYL